MLWDWFCKCSKKYCKLDPATAVAGHLCTWVKQHCSLSGDHKGTTSPQKASRKEGASSFSPSFVVPSNATLGESKRESLAQHKGSLQCLSPSVAEQSRDDGWS